MYKRQDLLPGVAILVKYRAGVYMVWYGRHDTANGGVQPRVGNVRLVDSLRAAAYGDLGQLELPDVGGTV